MSRYYEIAIKDTPGPTSVGTVQVWSSMANGVFDPGALNVQLDLLASTFAIPVGNSTISIDGIALSDLLQPQQYAGMLITVKGGMQAGLPLANPSQSGVLLQGMILQSFGNWVGTDMNINFVVSASKYTLGSPGNFVFNWQKGQSLADAIANTLNVVYPGAPRVMNIGSQYATSAPIVHAVQNLNMFSTFIKSLTSKDGGNGVDIAMLDSGALFIYDGSIKTSAVQIAFTDLIGQPRWVDQNIMQFTTVMRADIQVGSFVHMPQGLPYAAGSVTTTAGSNPLNLLKYKTSFQGQFVIQQVRHVGNFRDPDGTSWATVFQAAAVNVS